MASWPQPPAEIREVSRAESVKREISGTGNLQVTNARAPAWPREPTSRCPVRTSCQTAQTEAPGKQQWLWDKRRGRPHRFTLSGNQPSSKLCRIKTVWLFANAPAGPVWRFSALAAHVHLATGLCWEAQRQGASGTLSGWHPQEARLPPAGGATRRRSLKAARQAGRGRGEKAPAPDKQLLT